MTSIIDQTVAADLLKRYAREIRQMSIILTCTAIISSIYHQFNSLQDLLGNTKALGWLMGAWVTGVLLLCFSIFLHVVAIKKQNTQSSNNN